MKKTKKQSIKIAVAQVAPVIMNKTESIKKTVSIIRQAAKQGAELIVFPESYIPAYPRGFSFGMVVGSRTMEGREDWKRYYDNSVLVPSDDTDIIAEVAKETGVFVSLGITERDENNYTLYCTNLFFDPVVGLIGKHRKLKPTGTERCIWGEGDASTLTTIDTEYGVLGSLICWENYMPLARTAMYKKGVSIYIAPTADSREQWQATMKHIALEGRCFVIGCNQFVTKDMYPTDLKCYNELQKEPELMCAGGSCIVSPFGEYVAGPIWNKEDILYAELDLNLVVLSRVDFDPCGHYSRPDVFELKINH
ncbi:carbon-nitrogen hydrolase family protein [Clostridium sp. 'deep sea']|uniref:carbon-nitrogen hydrolase family protein n=1 Tax=Clostridium sp. 'deep sea' TaxID=2779445 RepID=UPI0024345EBA|nr:carbon-nitrogen hydrolase family protein [Clostridium sp. 'deep sea']